MRVTYWWIDSAGKVVKYGDVVAIPRDVLPGGQFTMDLGIVTPGPGMYRLHFALMRAPSTWFDPGTDRAVNIT